MDVEEEELDKWEGELIFFERKQQRNEKKTKREREQRKKINKENDQTFSGLVWTGEESVSLGLADAFGSVTSVARDIVKAETIVNYSKRESLLERAARRVGASFGETVMWGGRSSLQ